MIIRNFKDGDEKYMQKIHHYAAQTMITHYDKETLDGFSPLNISNEKLDKMKESFLSSNCFVAEIDGVIVGFSDITNEGYLWRMYVHPKYSKKGIGSKLMKKILETAKTLKLNKITTDASLPAKPYYEKHGFVVKSKDIKKMRNVEMGVYKMEKII